ncbi:MAG: tetratricopeptide repeat protein [Candidatus Aminicenantales bacterium]
MRSNRERDKIIEQAEKYVKKGKFEEAIAEYRKLLDRNAQDLSIRSLIGDLYIKSGQIKRAIIEFAKLANIYEERGRASQALAIYKKMNRLNPEDIDIAKKLAELYFNQGIFSEAKAKYFQIGEILNKLGKSKEAISFYEKILKIDKGDNKAKLLLADLYLKEGLKEKAIEEFNEVAELEILNKNFKKAEEILNQARMLNKDNVRTISNLITIFKKAKQEEKALELVNDVLKRDENNLKALSLLGNLYFDKQDFEKAEEIFKKILSLRSKDVEARFKLGRLYIQRGRLDEAFATFEPLVEALVRKQKEDKAIGLLGLILTAKKPHIPTLEKLAAIYKKNNQIKELEVTYRAIWQECRHQNLSEKALAVLQEIIKLSPMDEAAYKEYQKLKKELGLEKEEGEAAEPQVFVDEAKEIIKENFAKADLYLEQGLIRNARRILENLKMKFPEEPIIDKKIKALNRISSQVKEEEIPDRVERVVEKEVQIFGRELTRGHPESSPFFFEEGEEKLTAADLFAETDIIPVVSQEEKEKVYYDLKERIEEELETIRFICNKQLKGDTADMEKKLEDILAKFKEGIETKVSQENYETRFNLGIAYLEQGLIDEAIAEFKIAAKDKKRSVDCYSVLSYCYREKKDFKQSLEWLNRALEIAEKGTNQFYGLKYELASLYHEMKDRKKSLSLYQEIKKWNPKYRDVSDRIEELQKKSNK